MHHQRLSLLSILYSSFLLHIYGQNWYSAGLNNFQKNKTSFNEDVYNYKNYITQNIQHLTLPEKNIGSVNNISEQMKFNKLPNIWEPLQNERGVKRNNTINRHREKVNTVYVNNVNEDYSEVIESSDTINKTKFSHISFNNTIENVNVFRPRPNKFRRCPNFRPIKRKPILNRGRGKKFLEVFQIVEFEHGICTSSSGLEGKCLHEYECKSSGGAPMGDCADGYGTCCVLQLSCGDQSDSLLSWFTNPGYPSPSTDRLSCAVTLDKASTDVAQIRLDFITFELQPPSYGTCKQDQFVVSGQNINSFIPILCGINNGQHIYVEVTDVVGPIYLSIQTVTSDTRLFAIKITQLTSAHPLIAPTGCLQYFTDIKGNLESFNYQDTSAIAIARNPSYLNNLNYAMCIKRGAEMCTISYSNDGDMQIINYDLEGLPVIPPGQAGVEIFNCPSDWLLTAAARLCGERFNDGSVLQDFSLNAPVTDVAAGPIIVWFKSDAAVTGRGFKLDYQQNSCINPV